MKEKRKGMKMIFFNDKTYYCKVGTLSQGVGFSTYHRRLSLAPENTLFLGPV